MRWRYGAIILFFVAAFAGIWGKLFYWQIVRAEDLSQLELKQSAANTVIPAKRGEILTSDNFPLVTNSISYLAYINPQIAATESAAVKLLSDIFNLDQATVSARLAQQDKVWVPLKSGIGKDEYKRISDLHLTGVGFEEQASRFYPEASLAAQLVGFVGKDQSGNPKGYSGLEGYYEHQLSGRPGRVTVVRDAMGKPIFAKLNSQSGQQDGRTLVLTLDRVIQYNLEQALKKGVETYGALSGTAAIMDPKNGGILAMASFPSFDPRDYWDFDTDLYRNPFISDTYEPGSTFKPLVMATAIDKHLVTPDMRCNICDGPVKIFDYELHTWNDKYFPNTNMIDVIKNSDNTGMVFVSKKLGLDGMIGVLEKFGIGQATGIDLQGEFIPQIKSRENWYPIDVATASFGQGIAVTPIELLSAFSSIANDGVRMQPHLVSGIITSDHQDIPIQPKELGRTMSSETAKIMTEILVNAVNKGEANFARLHGYRIAGKTGTASIPVSGHYDTTKTIASFIGFAPADDPRFSMIVLFNRPTISIYGAETAAPVFFQIARDVLSYYKILPSGDN